MWHIKVHIYLGYVCNIVDWLLTHDIKTRYDRNYPLLKKNYINLKKEK